jgi:RNA polymerase subunit RPABC4/transcription elongation factor Spt4
VPFQLRFADHSFSLPPGETLIGRDVECQIQLKGKSISRRHARLLLVGDQPTLEDLGSRNGTLINGQRVKGRRALVSGDEVTIGSAVFVLMAVAPAVRTPESGDATAPGDRPYQVPEMRSCVGCRHLISLRDTTCPLCGAPQTRTEDAGLTIDVYSDPRGRRRTRRFSVKLRGLYVSASITIDCEIVDLSLHGAFVRADLLDEPGTACDLVVFVANKDVVRLTGRVARLDRESEHEGMGIEFGELGTSAAAWVATVVAMMERQAQAKK